MPDDHYQQLRAQLNEIERELKRQQLWQSTPPPPTAFDSQTPFFADTMAFEHWLQWVMLPRFHAMIDAASPLPDNCAIAPMAEHLWQQHIDKQPLIGLLAELDALFSR